MLAVLFVVAFISSIFSHFKLTVILLCLKTLKPIILLIILTYVYHKLGPLKLMNSWIILNLFFISGAITTCCGNAIDILIHRSIAIDSIIISGIATCCGYGIASSSPIAIFTFNTI